MTPVSRNHGVGFVLLISVVNLWVSFGLVRAYFVQLKDNPAAFLLPPAESPGDQADAARP